jgi:gluconokinase
VIAGTHDGGTANIGAHSFEHGESVITVGTSGAIRHVVDRPLLDTLERTWCYWLGEGRWLAGGAINNGGVALQWVREKFYAEIAGEAGYQKLLEEATANPRGADGLFFLPYFNGERSPYWDAAVRAQISGLGLEHTRGHIARAAMEGVAFCLADVWVALQSRRTESNRVRLTGGITQAPGWSQIVADVLGLPLLSLEAADASAFGAAMLGHQALGSATIDHLAPPLPEKPTFIPDSDRHTRYSEIHRHFQDLYHRTAPFFHAE